MSTHHSCKKPYLVPAQRIFLKLYTFLIFNVLAQISSTYGYGGEINIHQIQTSAFSYSDQYPVPPARSASAHRTGAGKQARDISGHAKYICIIYKYPFAIYVLAVRCRDPLGHGGKPFSPVIYSLVMKPKRMFVQTKIASSQGLLDVRRPPYRARYARRRRATLLKPSAIAPPTPAASDH